MKSKYVAYVAIAASGLSAASIADARSMRAVGSSTVYPFAKQVAERVSRANPKLGTPIIESTGTGGGIKLFCAGVGQRFPDVANASRRMKASEAKACKANGVGAITEVQVGIDGIAFASSKQNPIADLTTREIYMALAKTPFGKPNRSKTWKDINPRLPALPIRVYGPPPTSGTRDALTELILTAGCETNAGMKALAKSDKDKHKAVCTGVREDGAFIEAGENDNLIVQKLAQNPNTLGIFGYSYLEENASKLKGISINGVAPTYEAISSFKYPGARPLYVYVKNAHAAAIPAVRAFVAEFTKESAFGPSGYLRRIGLIAAPTKTRASAQAAARGLKPLNTASLK